MSKTPATSPTIDQLIEFPTLSDAQISPDGQQVAYVVTTPDWKENRFVAQIWLATADSEIPPRQLTFAKRSSNAPRWSPDGQWLAFLSRRNDDKATQLYRLSPFGGEAERLTELETAVQNPAWSPDGKTIAFTTIETESAADKKREETYGDYHVEDQDFRFAHLWLLELDNKKSRKLTAGKTFTVSGFNWSPDSQALAFTGTPTPDIADWENGRIYTVTLDTLTIQPHTAPGYVNPHWSPDGRQIACSAVGERYYHINRPTLINLDSGKVQPIPTSFDEDLYLLKWHANGLYFTAVQRTASHLFHLDPASGQVTQLSPAQDDGWVSMNASFSASHAALIADDAAHVKELVLLNLADGGFRRLTQYQEKVQDWALGITADFRWTSQDGTPIEGVLTKPANFDPHKQYPLLVIIHGGPTWASFRQKLSSYEQRVYPMPLWLAKDALILQPNYRGSTGYGAAFRALNVRNLGVGDYEDVISGVDALIAQGWVDPERVGAMGWSQGGYISMFIATYSDRFKAVSAGAGIANWMTYYVNTDIHPFTRHYLDATPWDDDAIYKRTSPMTYIKQAKTPTLIQHGSSDARVPPPNAYELYQGLRDVGTEVKLVTYPGMPHGPTRPRQCRSLMQDNLDWFNRWIWEEKAEDGEKRPCYIALATPEQADAVAELAAIQRYTAVTVQDTYHWARRDGADFRILSAGHGLLAPDTAIPPDPRPELAAADIPALAAQFAELFSQARWPEVVLYTGSAEKRPSHLIALGCLQVAAGLAGKVTVKHQEITAEGWEETEGVRVKGEG